jgi:hypothetical protein
MCAFRHLGILRECGYGSTRRLGGQIVGVNVVRKTILTSDGNRNLTGLHRCQSLYQLIYSGSHTNEENQLL